MNKKELLATLSQVRKHTNEVQAGETVSHNHEDCPAGEDRRHRLYITRKYEDPNRVFWYCHNCSEGGSLPDNEYSDKWRIGELPADSDGSRKDTEKFEIPRTTVYDLSSDLVPIDAIMWIQKYLTLGHAQKYGLGFDPVSRRIVIPRWATMDKDIAYDYQLRRVEPYASVVPKYITHKNREVNERTAGVPLYFTDYPVLEHVEACVIVEDVVSAIKVAESGGNFLSSPICGLSMSHTKMHKLTKTLRVLEINRRTPIPVVIWLDNDGTQVTESAREMKEFLQVLSPKRNVYIESEYNDPKGYSYTLINKHIGAMIT